MTASGHYCEEREARKQSPAVGSGVFVVYTPVHAVAALTAAAGRPVVLMSAAGAGIYAGPGWWRELIAAARARVPAAECTAILDCGDDSGAAQAALRAGVEIIVFTGRVDVAERLADVARQRGGGVLTERPVAALDLGEEYFALPERLRQLCSERVF